MCFDNKHVFVVSFRYFDFFYVSFVFFILLSFRYMIEYLGFLLLSTSSALQCALKFDNGIK